ncbi:MAG TPA: hypothetical protein VLG11_01955 [Candidatus Saccharimonadales bacterium]|nr:hypothetical protein [Candidatus Saccharimonadales bacterium]
MSVADSYPENAGFAVRSEDFLSVVYEEAEGARMGLDRIREEQAALRAKQPSGTTPTADLYELPEAELAEVISLADAQRKHLNRHISHRAPTQDEAVLIRQNHRRFMQGMWEELGRTQEGTDMVTYFSTAAALGALNIDLKYPTLTAEATKMRALNLLYGLEVGSPVLGRADTSEEASRDGHGLFGGIVEKIGHENLYEGSGDQIDVALKLQLRNAASGEVTDAAVNLQQVLAHQGYQRLYTNPDFKHFRELITDQQARQEGMLALRAAGLDGLSLPDPS